MTRKTMLVLAAALASACGPRAKGVAHLESRPAALVDLEVASELAYERALEGDVAAVASASTRVLDDWARVRVEAGRRGADDEVLTELDSAVLALGHAARSTSDRVVLARAANRITGSLDELFAVYDPTLTSSVMELDYLGRELAVDGLALDMHRAGTHVSMLDDRWSELRPQLETAGTAGAAELGDAIAATRAAVDARDADDIAAAASALVDRVYDLESGLGSR